MTEERTNPKAEAFFQRAKEWKGEYEALRKIIMENPDLVEEYKWMKPCYTYEGHNVVLIHGFKDYCALLFHKGVLLPDPELKLIQQTKNVQAARQLRFTSVAQIIEEADMIRDYIKEAVAVEKAGKKVEMKRTEEYDMPEELKAALEADKKLDEAFHNLTPGRQRQYMYTIGQAKRASTRQNRVDKYKPMILQGKGLND
ncbi:YdeI/OmpD-associated family protein [Staphylococcus carnosus]|uniref:YdeI/OmpD-associated family protein n=1 Tax=Staphylococcus carnosus TaxID=1281 RepID=UPI0020A57187|nr:DUF1801 domain-containing protein [Staphylococcus carnosus]UTB79933.1 hypothetical protein A2I65_03060 [Staphylococcus carnosus]